MAAALQSRRRFILALISGVAALTALGRYLKSGPPGRKVLLDLPLADIPADSALVFKDERVAVARSGAGFYALSLICTHLGCTVSVTPEGLFCPCHGSRFDKEGKVLQGPAGQSLRRLTVSVEHDRVIISD